jgi:DNA-binding NarL/FixJ family response regulator
VITVLIADDQDLVREGLRMLLEAEPDLAVAGEAADGSQALAQARRLDPDVVLMDVRMPQMNGIEATTRLVQAGSRARILMLTTFDLDEYVYHALKAGASGFLLKDATREQLTGAVRAVSAGEALLAPAITQRLIEDFCRGPAPGAAGAIAAARLSDRELGVVRLVAKGLSNAEIAARLYLSEATVKSHIARILAKLGLRDRVQVAVYAYEHGIVRPGGNGRLLPEEPVPGRDERARVGGPPRSRRVGAHLRRLGQQRLGDVPYRGEPVGAGEQRAVSVQHVVDQPDIRWQRIGIGQAGQGDVRVSDVEVKRRPRLLGHQGKVDLTIPGE